MSIENKMAAQKSGFSEATMEDTMVPGSSPGGGGGRGGEGMGLQGEKRGRHWVGGV